MPQFLTSQSMHYNTNILIMEREGRVNITVEMC